MVENQIVLPRLKDRHYIDVTTNLINTTTGVSGTNNSFSVQIEPLLLDPQRQYSVQVLNFYYQNSNIGAGIYPIITSDIGYNIRVVNTNSSIIFKSNVDASNTNFVSRDVTNNANFVLPVSSQKISQIFFQIVRSDTGALFPMTSPVQLTLYIESE
jgi:hypothetical protein